MKFEWDDKKAISNLKKHGISFEEASTVFGDWLAITIEDPLHSESEDRFIIIGKSELLNTLVVVHVERSEAIRIISARTASKNEQKFYEEQQ
ncbi:BrnT family toxin [Sulfuricurvum sp.]|uniref:BrnT family toxin n=1 Tax=Sulfuricurvum sp. TaxID=2025608 RepID=UPI003BB6162E